jgi:alpha-mannosidase
MDKKWKYALCQHPMWLIIDEDTVCAERTPPWGAPSLEVYVERLRRNLDALNRYPELKINFDTSGVELEDMAARYPDVIEKMRGAVKDGRLSFLNGTYSQPHLQNFGLESLLRQFDYGLEVYQRLFKYPVNTYAAQEVGITEQMPQVLIAHRFKFAVVPHFSWAITFLTPHEVVGYEDHLETVNGCEFTSWQGLDKTEIPLYVTQVLFNKGITDKALELETVRDLYQGPPIKAYTPDLIEVDEHMVEEQLKNGDFIRLDKALEQRIKEKPPLSKARFYTYWSYVEGIGAEALSRANMKAEQAILQAETIQALLPDNGNISIDIKTLWKQILKSQHHDAYWAGAPELRQKSIQWLQDVSQKAETYSSKRLLDFSNHIKKEATENEKSLMVFTTFAKPFASIGRMELSDMAIHAPTSELVLRDSKSEKIPVQIHQGLNQSSKIVFPIESKGAGYQSYYLSSPPTKQTEKNIPFNKPLQYKNSYYSAQIYPDGTFSSLKSVSSGKELLKTKDYRGNELKGAICGQNWVSSKDHGTGILMRGPVADIVRSRGKLGENAYTMDIFLYHALPWIDVELEIDFKDAGIGDFVKDETKLNLYWPIKENCEIYQGIGGGTMKALPERPLFAINWVDMEGENGSLALLNHGTLKHWTRDNVLAMVIGWGKDGNQFTNRRHANWSKPFDLRLKGKQTICYSIYPHKGNWKQADIPSWAMAQTQPPIVLESDGKIGKLPEAKTLFTLPYSNVIPTSIRKEGKKIICRGYEALGKAIKINKNDGSSRIKSIRNLKGEKLSQINPFQIVEMEIK